ncbi:hypothetical protein GALMADRAFT_162182 [Galerina marginata CBS 339.88]|uniref:Uncharacterized protein n=1 Tax=Galerina marginata (strain CBS 339.88) TaxID=685588 RepID=A0A067SEY0_GALM3|nr:hypothetical protein GALMADRAFT_162182 [Galerina marginata CBS 339.88]
MAPKYELLPTSPAYSLPSSRSESPTYPPPYDAEQEYRPFEHDTEDAAPRRPRIRREPIPAFDSDPRFRVRTPSPYARAALLLFVAFLFWLAFAMRKALWVAGGMGMNKELPEVDPSY